MYLLNLLLLPVLAIATCPFQKSGRQLPIGHRQVTSQDRKPSLRSAEYEAAASSMNLEDIKADLKELFHTSQSFWPADMYDTDGDGVKTPHYGPFFIRLAWHCSGSYRTSDGRGGCDGGRQMFEPEQSWEDNTNLDKARTLLWPIKRKYGLGLSWGDLFILAGTTAIEDMKGPSLGFCGGRQDDPDGSASLPLGPSSLQDSLYPCEPGKCTSPLGTTTVGLIYVNPEGVIDENGVLQPDPILSAPQIRDTFGRMGMDDAETVVLIGGGHAFGKAHGACPAGAGKPPKDDPENPWPGLCDSGVFTSGFEGQWAGHATQWNNEFFKHLTFFNWTQSHSPADHTQWKREGYPDNDIIMMLTSDVALKADPAYNQLVVRYADSSHMLEFRQAFASAWYKLTTRDMGPATRCLWGNPLEPQDFQYPLPAPVVDPTLNYDNVRTDVLEVIHTEVPSILPFDASNSYGPLFVRLAWQCFNTFRSTDYMGGCNGARIRFLPESSWAANSYLDLALRLLDGVKMKYGDGLSWADLIVFAGNTAIEDAAARADKKISIPFTSGRSDALDEEPSTPSYLESRLQGGEEDDTSSQMRDVMQVMGLTTREFVALIGGGHGIGMMHQARSGFRDGAWTTTPGLLNNEWFLNLLNFKWKKQDIGQGLSEYNSSDGSTTLFMLKTDMQLLFDPEFKVVAAEFAQDNDMFLQEFSAAWVKIMNADIYNSETATTTLASSSASLGSSNNVDNYSGNSYLFWLIGAGCFVALLIVSFGIYSRYYTTKVDVTEYKQSMSEPLIISS